MTDICRHGVWVARHTRSQWVADGPTPRLALDMLRRTLLRDAHEVKL